LLGRKARAPRWMQQAKLEWAFRLLSEPRRLWRRYLVVGPRVFRLALSRSEF
jgi:exopolysaccharide biosynthesis WecB/TagA/CpsF family protein